MDWKLYTDCTVSELLERFDQTPRLVQLMWRPLCLAALNTPPERASAQVFLNVLRDSLGARRSASDMLLPRRDLGALFPQAAAAFIEQHGGTVHCGVRIDSVTPVAGRWQLGTDSMFDAVVLATPLAATATLLAEVPEAAAVHGMLQHFSHEAITTCYLQYPAPTRLDLPFYALADAPEDGAWGQFVFDRGQLDAGQAGLLAVVVSASEAATLNWPPPLQSSWRPY
jgi:predicted NAD/FAD-binding protein